MGKEKHDNVIEENTALIVAIKTITMYCNFIVTFVYLKFKKPINKIS